MCRSTEKDDVVIALLKFAKAQLPSPITQSDACNHFEKKGIGFEREHVRRLFDEMFVGGNEKQFVKAESYFNLLDHFELIEARQQARDANFHSIAAIVLSVISIIVSTWVNK